MIPVRFGPILLAAAAVAACAPTPSSSSFGCAESVDAAAAASMTVTAYGIEPSAPLWLGVGERRPITVVNRSGHGVTVHFHGLRYVDNADGTPGHSNISVPPDCARRFVVQADRPGVWPYHVHPPGRESDARFETEVVVTRQPAQAALAAVDAEAR